MLNIVTFCTEVGKPGQTVIIDNASFHKSPYFKSIIENTGCNLLYLSSKYQHIFTKLLVS